MLILLTGLKSGMLKIDIQKAQRHSVEIHPGFQRMQVVTVTY
jgi:hypothetical protein